MARSHGGYVLTCSISVRTLPAGGSGVGPLAEATGHEPVDGDTKLRLAAVAVLLRLVLNVALSLVPSGDDDGQSVFFADSAAGAADEVITTLIGVIVLVVLKADRIENQVVMNVFFVHVGSEDKFILAANDLPRQSMPIR